MLTDAHSHRIISRDVRTIYNIRINDLPPSLPHGENILFSAGIHPKDAASITGLWIENLKFLLNFDQVIAIGECGMDKNAPVAIEKQLEVFALQIKFSEIHNKPLIIHCVGCYNELINLHRALNPKQPWIIHGFRGKPEMAVQLVKFGMYLSFGEKFNPESLAITPIERILAETDDSEMDIEEIYENLCKLKLCRVEDLHAAETIFGFE
ncbi:MAG: TatD family hydrolase [Paludibacter sp.]|nr:TatD family hydrolase [Paludibacter sp.]